MPLTPPTSVLIVGAGYIGWPLALEFFRRGLVVYATSRKPERLTEFAAVGVNGVPFDVTDPTIISLPAVDAVVYAVGFDPGGSASRREVYVDGLACTLERLPQPQRFVYVSSTGVYGDAGGAWVDEDSAPAPIDEGGRLCLEAENRVREYCDRHSVAWNICRLAGIYGPGRMIGAQGLKRGESVAGRPDGWLNLIHRVDAVEALAAVVERAPPGCIYNVADGAPTLRRDFYETVARGLGVAPPTFAPELARRQRGDRRVDANRIVRELGLVWRHPSFESALDDVLAADPTD